MGCRMNATKVASEVARIRDRIAAKKNELFALEQAKVPRDIADRAADNSIEWHAERGRISVASFADGHGLLSQVEKIRGFDLLCWISPDLVRKRFSDELDRFYEGVVAMDAASISKRRAALEAELFDLEVAEERLIAQAEEAGQRINRRGDADPRAILEA